MNIIKMIFNRSSLIGLLIIVQFTILVLAILIGGKVFPYLFLILFILSIITFLYILNKDQDPTTKLPWLLVVLVLQPVGMFLYLLFGNNKVSKKQRKWHNEIFQMGLSELNSSKNAVVQLEYADTLAASQSKYITDSCFLPLYTNTQTEFFPSGESFFEDFKKEIKKAKKFIFMEYFIIKKGKMWDETLALLEAKIAEGVEVRLLYDDLGTIYHIPGNYDKILAKKGINVVKFSPFVPIMSSIHNNRDHRKITVIDGKIAYTGGLNFADEYINETLPFGEWKDSAIKVKGEAVKAFTTMFMIAYCTQTKKIEDFEPYIKATKPVKGATGFVQAYMDGPAPLFPDRVAENVYLNIINQAKDYIYITTPYLIVDYNFISALKLAARRGVNVQIITPHIPDKKIVFFQTQASYKALVDAGVKIFEWEPGFIHSKTFVSDDNLGVVSTVNLDYRSFVHHYECGVWLYNTNSVMQIKNEFENARTNSIEITEEKAKLNIFKRLCAHLLAIFAPLM